MQKSHARWQLPAIFWPSYHPPQRPSPSDIKHFAEVFTGLSRDSRVLLLGVTPEVRALATARASSVVAVDASLPMIKSVYSKADAPSDAWSSAVQASWDHLPFKDASFDAVLGDGVCVFSGSASFNSSRLAYWARFLKPGRGVLAVRVFERPCLPQPLLQMDDIVKLADSNCLNLDELRWQLAYELADENGQVPLSLFYEELVGTGFIDWLARRFDEAELSKFLNYRGSPGTYWFPTREEFISSAASCESLRLNSTRTASDYPLAQYCPVYSFHRLG